LRTVPLPPVQPKRPFPKDDEQVQNYPDLLKLAPDGKTLAVVEKIVHYDRFSRPSVSRQIRVWDLIKLEQIDLFSTPTSNVVAFSPDSKWLAFGRFLDDAYYDREFIVLWERSTKTMVKVPAEQRPFILTGLSFQSDGKTLAAFSTRELDNPGHPRSSTVLLWHIDAVVAKKKPADK
jgi:WD40 repeat protein